MNYRAALLVLTLMIVPMPVAAQEASKPEWSVYSVSVENEPAKKRSLLTTRLGTRVAFGLRIPKESVVGIDLPSSHWTFTDDKAADLMKDPRESRYATYGITSVRMPYDRSYCRILLHAPGCPTRGATKSRIKGTLAVLVGRNEKVIEKKNVPLSLGVELPKGKLALGSSPGRSQFIYTGESPLKSLKLLTSDGSEVEFEKRGYYEGLPTRILRQESTPFRGIFNMRGRHDRVTVQAVYFESVEKIMVPMDFEVSFGLQ